MGRQSIPGRRRCRSLGLRHPARRTDDVRLGARSTVQLAGPGDTGSAEAVSEVREVLPDRSALVEVTLPVWPLLRASGGVEVTPLVVGEDVVEVKLERTTAAVAVWTPPWSQLALVLLVVAGVLLVRWLRRRSARRVQAQLRRGKRVTEAIHAAGYGSHSPFYDAAAKDLGMRPGDYRAGGRGNTIRFAVAQCTLGALLVAASSRGVCAILLGNGRFPADVESLKLFDEWLIPVCHPSYLEQARPELSVLSSCEFLHPSPDRRDWRRWLARMDALDISIDQGQVFDTLDQGISAAQQGLGISVGATLSVGPALLSGELVPVLGDHAFEPTAIFAVYPSARQVSTKVRAVVDFLAETLQEPPIWDRDLAGKVPGF